MREFEEKDCADNNLPPKVKIDKFCFRDLSEKVFFTSQLIHKSSLLSFIEQLWDII